MSEYEDIVELGFEGVDKFAHKYHDKVYGHLPAFRKKQVDQQRQQDQQQHKQPPSTNEQQRNRQDSAVEGERGLPQADRGLPQTDRDMSSYGPSYNGQQGYRDDRDARAFDQYQPHASSPVGYAYDDRFNDPRAYDGQYRYGYPQQPRQNRPDMSRQRSNSWSPRDREQEDRRGRNRDQESKHRNRRERSSSGPSLTEPDCAKRLAAAAVGALLGGFAANKLAKGQKYDTAATFGGAVLGGIASREIADRVGHRKEDKRGKEQDEEQAWEQKWGKDEKGHKNDRNRIEYDRDDYRDDRRDDRRHIRD